MTGTGAEVLTRFTGNTKDLDSKTKSASSSLKSFASGVATAFKLSAAAIGAMSVAIGNVVKASVDAYAEFEQLEGGLVSLFGEGSAEMNRILKTSEEAWEDLTMSQNDYLTSFQSAYPLVNAGLSSNADSIEYTNKILQLSSDLFNTYGGSVEQYQNAINWALKGSFVYLDNLNLGIKGTQEGFIEAANASGILGRQIKNVSELTSDEIIDVIQHYAEAYGVWGKTADEAATTIIGSLNMTKSAWSNLIAGFSKDGADIDKLIDNFISSLTKFGKNILPVIKRALSSVAKALPSILGEVGKLLPELINTLLPALINGSVLLINNIIPQLPLLLQTLLPALVQGFIMIIQGLIQQLPTIIPMLIEAIIQLMDLFNQHIDEMILIGFQLLLALGQGILNAIPNIIQNIPTIIMAIINAFTLVNFWNLGTNLLKNIGNGLIDFVPNLLTNIKTIIAKMINTFKLEGLGAFKSIGTQLIKGLVSGLKAAKDLAINAVKNLGKTIIKGIKAVLGIKSPSKEFAVIGRFSVLGYTEALDDMTKTVQGQIAETFSVSPQLANSSSLHYSPNVVTNTFVNVESDPLGQTVRNIKTFAGGAKNDFNYGQGV